jgi:hypothetical protein
VADAVQVEPVSTVKFPANREINRISRNLSVKCDFERLAKQIQWLAAKFPTQQNREFFAKNKEFARENREFEDVIVDRDP